MCSANQFRICASDVWSTKMSLAQSTFCGIFNKNISSASLDSSLFIKSDYLFENARVVGQSVYNTSVRSGVSGSQSTISLFFSAIQIPSRASSILSTYYSGSASDFSSLLL